MLPLTREWVHKAEADWLTAQRELVADPYPNYDAVCFHSQQCAEKCLKARLVEAGLPFPKTHDLDILLNLVLPVEPSWSTLRTATSPLTDMAVEVRYPGASASETDAQQALRHAEKIRNAVRAAGLSV